jgi:uncharacterized membrane protein
VDRGRLEAFSDGVFAVAITLLALNLFVPGPGHGHLLMQLGDRWPSFVAYLISFFTIGIIWVNHHEFVKNIAVIGRTLLFLNLVLLLFVVMIPFATGTMAEYLTAGGQDSHVSMALFAGVYEGMGAAFGALFLYTVRRGHTLYAIEPEARRAVMLRFTFGAFAYLAAIAVGFFAPPISLGIVGLVAVYYIVDRTPGADAPAAQVEP